MHSQLNVACMRIDVGLPTAKHITRLVLGAVLFDVHEAFHVTSYACPTCSRKVAFANLLFVEWSLILVAGVVMILRYTNRCSERSQAKVVVSKEYQGFVGGPDRTQFNGGIVIMVVGATMILAALLLHYWI